MVIATHNQRLWQSPLSSRAGAEPHRYLLLSGVLPDDDTFIQEWEHVWGGGKIIV